MGYDDDEGSANAAAPLSRKTRRASSYVSPLRGGALPIENDEISFVDASTCDSIHACFVQSFTRSIYTCVACIEQKKRRRENDLRRGRNDDFSKIVHSMIVRDNGKVSSP